ncbi:MAG: nucleotidyltransferase domain-containing protein [Thermodesulfobacteriota bacterium]|nr:nucleotidyltransferase domain-containing protein [Thermodesulfobacteriota bacterium]
MREIERRSGYAIGTIQTELKKLLRLELVEKRRDGNRLYYRANKNHPIYSDIHNLVLKTTGLVEIFKEALSHDSNIKTAFVFGSIASGEETPESDVDLMVIGQTGLRKLSKMLAGVSDRINREINPYALSQKEFAKRNKDREHFIARVIESPKMFIIGNANDLEAMGK